MTELQLRATELERCFRRPDGTITGGLRRADLELRAGEQLAILGHSGSGKSTLLSLLAGLSRPDRGRIELCPPGCDGWQDLWALSDTERCRLRQGRLGFVSQFTSLVGSLTVLENVLLPSQLAGERPLTALQPEAEHWLEQVGLGHRLHSLPEQLSGGELRRAILARALLGRPIILLADEPTSNLDDASEAEIFGLLQASCRRSGCGLVMVTHSHHLAERCDRILELRQGVLGPVNGDWDAATEPWAASLPPRLLPRRRVLAWMLGTGSLLLAGSRGWQQWRQQMVDHSRIRRNGLQALAFSSLSSELVRVGREDGDGYRGWVSVANLTPEQALYLLPLSVQLYIQQGLRWNPFPARWAPEASRVIALEQPREISFLFREIPDRFTELVPGYLHVRFDLSYAIADRPDPSELPQERRDSFFVYLQPPNPVPERLAANHFPGEAPLFIPMPPH